MSKSGAKVSGKAKKRGRLSQKETSRRSGPRPLGSSDQTTRQTLISAAKRLFARKGLTGTSIRDIAQDAGLNSSMISYYFDGKDGLYRACLEEIATTRLQFTRDILVAPETFEEYRLRLKMFSESLFQLFLEDRESGLIVIREFDRIHSPAEKVFKDNFLKLIELIVTFFKESQKRQFVGEAFDPFILASIFFGSLSNHLRLDHINEKTYGRSLKDPKERAKMCSQLIEVFSQLGLKT